MSFFEAGAFGWVESSLVVAYLIHATIVYALAWFISGWRIRYKQPLSIVPFDSTRAARMAVILMVVSTGILFSLGGVRILFLDQDRGEVRSTLGLWGFFYTWLQIYLTPFVVAVAANFHVRSCKNQHWYYYATYSLGLIIGIMSGYKFTTILIFLPALTLALSEDRWQILIFASLGAIAVLILTETMQSGRPLDEALTYLIARSTSVAAYGIMGSWNEFSQSGPSLMRILESSLLLFGSKAAVLLSGVPENSVEFLKYNLSRHITYLYYPNPDGAVDGTVNLTLTVFGEAVAFLGGTFFWLWSTITGVFIGFVLRAYSRAQMRGNVLVATLWLVYFFSVILAWINSSGWINLVSLPVFVGMILLRSGVGRIILNRRSNRKSLPRLLAI